MVKMYVDLPTFCIILQGGTCWRCAWLQKHGVPLVNLWTFAKSLAVTYFTLCDLLLATSNWSVCAFFHCCCSQLAWSVGDSCSWLYTIISVYLFIPLHCKQVGSHRYASSAAYIRHSTFLLLCIFCTSLHDLEKGVHCFIQTLIST